MAKNDKLVSDVNKLLKLKKDPGYYEKLRVLVPSENLVIGVRVPDIKVIVKEFAKKKNLSFEESFDLLDRFFKRQIREEILFGIFLVTLHKKELTKEHFEKVDEWADYIENWEVCDQLGNSIGVEIVTRNPELLKELEKWTASPNLWRRRFVFSVGSCLNQKGRSNVDEVLHLCSKLMHDKERMVEKALGWAIKEASKKDEKKVYEFLKKYRGKIERRLMREASEKLPGKWRMGLLK